MPKSLMFDQEKLVAPYLEVIVSETLKDFKPRSIILFGGFGKGEGTFVMRDGKPEPFNDFDLYIVSDEKIDDDKLDSLGKRISNLFGKSGVEFVEDYNTPYDKDRHFHVDFRFIKYSDLPKMMKTQRTYELKNASRVIYGENVLEQLPSFPASEIPLYEGIRNLFVKAGLMLIAINERRLNNDFVDNEKDILVYYSMKTLMSCAEALLIYAGEFVPTYKGRAEKFSEIYEKKFPSLCTMLPTLADDVKKATSFKLNADFSSVKEPLELWFSAKDSLVHVLSFILSDSLDKRRLNNNLEDSLMLIKEKLPYSYLGNYLKSKSPILEGMFFAQYYFNILYFLSLYRKRKLHFAPLLSWRDIGLDIALANIIVLESITRKGIDYEKLRLSKPFIERAVPCKLSSFASYREAALEAFGNYYLQKLI